MAQQRLPSGHPPEKPQGDAFHAMGAVVSGPVFYGLIGWALDRWLHTSFLAVVGILVGVALGLYMTWARFRPRDTGAQPGEPDTKTSQQR